MSNILTEKGIALLMVIWILALLSVIVGEFCFTMRTQVHITRNVKETTEAHYIAVAGANAAIEQIIRQTMTPSTRRESDENQRAEDGEAEEEAEEEEVQWRVNTQLPPMSYGNGEYHVWIDNEGGKVNINLAGKEILRAMLAGFAIDDAEKDIIVDSIQDWRDANDLHLMNGAEDDYYLALPEPYECKDDYFDSVEELLMVRGVTPEIFYGGLEHMVTVVPREKPSAFTAGKRKKNQFDYNKLNMNAIPPGLWASLPGMTEEALDQILEFRKTQNFKSPRELAEIVGPEVYGGIARYLTLWQIPYFTIRSVGMIKDSRIAEGIEAVVCISSRLENNYQVLLWKEGTTPMAHLTARPGTQQEASLNG